jgi:hypothetical protein
MIVRKVRGEDKVSKIILSDTEAQLVRKMGIPIETYIKEQLISIAKKRKWKWYFNKESK